MPPLWKPSPIRFHTGVHPEELVIQLDELAGRRGVYVHITAPAQAGGVFNVYGGSAASRGLQWRVIEHCTSLLGLMYDLYDQDGYVVFPEPGTDHVHARVRAFCGEYAGRQLSDWQALAR